MPIPDTSGVPPFADFDMLKSKLNEIVQKYNNLLVGLDTLNIVSLNAEVIEAGTITGDKIAANSITADKISVSQLSAISANLGTITAGLLQAVTIIGSLIQTKTAGNYPRVELSASSNVIKAESDSENSLTVYSSMSGFPTLIFNSGTGAMQVFQFGNLFNMAGIGNVNINTSSGKIDIDAPGGVYANGKRLDLP